MRAPSCENASIAQLRSEPDLDQESAGNFSIEFFLHFIHIYFEYLFRFIYVAVSFLFENLYLTKNFFNETKQCVVFTLDRRC